MLDVIRFLPPARSVIYKSKVQDEILEVFEEACRKYLLKEISSLDDAVEVICGLDTSLRSASVLREMKDAIAAVSQMAGIIPDVDPDVAKTLDDEEQRLRSIGQIRRGVTAVFLGTVKSILQRPELMLKMKPKDMAQWFKMVREEEDAERTLALKAREQDREDAKLKLMFFQAASGQLGKDDIDMLQEDLRQDLTTLLNGGKITLVTGTPADAPDFGAS